MSYLIKHSLVFLLLISSLVVLATAPSKGRLENDPVFGGKVYLLETGDISKETVVLVHGLGSAASDDWKDTIKALRESYHILALDLPGFGRSDKGNKSYSPTKYAALIRYITSRYAKRTFHLVGHSMGGAVALRYASSYPEDVASLTLIDAAGILHRLAYSKFLVPMGLEFLVGGPIPGRSTVSSWTGVLLGTLEQKLPIDIQQIQKSSFLRQKILQGNPSTIASMGLVMEDFSRAPGLVKAPTLIIWGENDEIAPLRTGYVLNALISNSRLKIIKGGGHVPMKAKMRETLGYLKSHLKGHSGPPVKQKASYSKYQGDVVCEGKYGQFYSGRIGRLVLKKCNQSVVENAQIDKLIIDNSQVVIRNSWITNKHSALVVNNSSVEITAGEISGEVAIQSTGSQLDLAGTRLNGTSTAVQALTPSKFIFSLVPIKSSGRKESMIHGQKLVTPQHPL